jgi:hypothetical protein
MSYNMRNITSQAGKMGSIPIAATTFLPAYEYSRYFSI